MDYSYGDDRTSVIEVIGLVFLFGSLTALIGLVVYSLTNPNLYEYEKDGETHQADYCYTGRTDEFVCEEDGRRFHVDTYRKYRKGER